MVLLLFFSVDREVWRSVANFIRFTGMLVQGLMLGGRVTWHRVVRIVREKCGGGEG